MRSAPIRGSLRGPERPRYKAVSERLRLRGATCSLLVGLVVNRERGEVLFICQFQVYQKSAGGWTAAAQRKVAPCGEHVA